MSILVFCITIRNNLTNCVSDGLISLSEDPCKYFLIYRDFQWLTDLIEEIVQLFLLRHRALHFEEVVSNLFHQLIWQVSVFHRSVDIIDGSLECIVTLAKLGNQNGDLTRDPSDENKTGNIHAHDEWKLADLRRLHFITTDY